MPNRTITKTPDTLEPATLDSGNDIDNSDDEAAVEINDMEEEEEASEKDAVDDVLM
jgi:hypothetical protein